MTTAEQLVITEPGVYEMPDEAYHGDPVPGGSLSASGARKLLAPHCPARFHYDRTHPQDNKREFDIGKAAHKIVLGSGPDITVVDADSWRTKAAQEAKKAAYAEGSVPVLTHEYDEVTGMAIALAEHPLASALFRPGSGRPEQSLFWVDKPTGVWRRARLDWLPEGISSEGRLIIPDYKTCAKADPESIQKAVHNHRYYQQAAWYSDAAQAVLGAGKVAFLFVFQEKPPPHLITVVELDIVALRHGHDLNRQAIQTYAECTAADRWPGYSDDAIELVALPPWVENNIAKENR